MSELVSRIWRYNSYERDQWVAAQAARLTPGLRVLDVGAGPCRYRTLFGHCEYKAQDFCQHIGDATEPHWHYGKIDYVCDAAHIPLPDASVDVILCTEVLEHVPDPVALINECARLLAPDGLLLLTAPLGSGLHQEPHHFYGGYTPHWYHRFLTEAGFADIDIEANGGFFRLYGQESQRFASFLHPRNFRGPGRVAAAAAWIMAIPLFRVLLPLVCHGLDRLDTQRAFTAGYHVRARKGSRVPALEAVSA